MSKALVSFVVLNWNGLEDTFACLDSIRNQSYKNFEIIVVDNGSEQTQKNALAKIQDIKLIDLPNNTGFTGGQLAGYEVARGDYIALINNDAVIAVDWARRAVDCLETNISIAVIGGRAYNWKDDSKEMAFSTKNSFYSYQVVNPTTGHTRTVSYGEKRGSVNSISGSGVMIRRSAIEKVGYFDNTFFAYYEETDLFARFKRAGYEINYNPSMHTWHKIAQSTKSKPGFYLYHMHRNRFMFAVKNYDRKYLFKFIRFYIGEWLKALRHVVWRGKDANLESKKMVRAGFWNYLHILSTLRKRAVTQRLGKTYSNLLLGDLDERISIIIPCYNYADYVAEAIDSALAQTQPIFEIIVINDGSTDNSLEIINRYSDRVTIVNQKNVGVIVTKNNGLKLAKSDWAVFLDADDVIPKNYVQNLLATARRDNADISYCGMQFIGKESGIFTSRPFSEYSILKGNYINNSALIRREKLLKIGGYKKEMSRGYEDWELYISLSGSGARFSYSRDTLLHYRRHAESSRDFKAQEQLSKSKELIKKLHPELYSKKHMTKDIVSSVLSFHKRRTPLQVIKDLRYIFVTWLDKKSEKSATLTKILGFCRLLTNRKFSVIVEKLSLNIRRLRNKLTGKNYYD